MLQNLASSELSLILASFFTSTLTAVFGVGGGVLLLTLMPGLVPPYAIIPLHGFVQLVSNSSRVAFAWRNVRWDMVRRYLLGACLGALLGSQVVLSLNTQYIPLILGVTILLVTWAPALPTDRLPGKYLSFGIIHSLLATLAGATGPLSSAFLSREGLKKNTLVTTVGAFMATTHGLKVVAFTLLGFSFAPYLELALMMSLCAILGSWFGTWLRQFIPEISFAGVFRWILTALACRLVWMTLA